VPEAAGVKAGDRVIVEGLQFAKSMAGAVLVSLAGIQSYGALAAAVGALVGALLENGQTVASAFKLAGARDVARASPPALMRTKAAARQRNAVARPPLTISSTGPCSPASRDRQRLAHPESAASSRSLGAIERCEREGGLRRPPSSYPPHVQSVISPSA
jgi:hypothetical protein